MIHQVEMIKNGGFGDGLLKLGYPLVILHSELENSDFHIVSFPMQKDDFPVRYVKLPISNLLVLGWGWMGNGILMDILSWIIPIPIERK